jgi:hypothetical protein
MDGQGKLVFPDGHIYEGAWHNDKMEGQGKLIWANGDIYEGAWRNGNPEGQGKFLYAEDGNSSHYTRNAGDVYQGGFKDGKRHGACTYTFFNGETAQFTWVNGVCPEFNARQAQALANAKSKVSAGGTVGPSTLAALLSQPSLSAPLHSLPSGSIQLIDEPAASDFCSFVRARVRREDAGVSISRISRVLLGGARMATYMDLFMREMSSRSSNPMLRPANHSDVACIAGLNKLKSLFERTCLVASPPCNIVFAWHGTPVQHVEAVCRDGPRAFRTTDGGFFGAGSYFAAELEYATRYAMMQVCARAVLSAAAARLCLILNQAPSASGEYTVILFAVSVACAYVVSPGRDYPADDPSQPQRWGFSKFYSDDPSRSVALMPRYNAHFVPVKYCGRMHCVTGKPLPLDTGYQAAVEGLDASE